MNYSASFSRHPAYSLQSTEKFDVSGGPAVTEDSTVAVIVMKKDVAAAFPLRPDVPRIGE